MFNIICLNIWYSDSRINIWHSLTDILCNGCIKLICFVYCTFWFKETCKLVVNFLIQRYRQSMASYILQLKVTFLARMVQNSTRCHQIVLKVLSVYPSTSYKLAFIAALVGISINLIHAFTKYHIYLYIKSSINAWGHKTLVQHSKVNNYLCKLIQKRQNRL